MFQDITCLIEFVSLHCPIKTNVGNQLYEVVRLSYPKEITQNFVSKGKVNLCNDKSLVL